jgi:hypothetical protein
MAHKRSDITRAMTLWCGECQKYMPISGVHVFEWKMECHGLKCRYAKWAGLSQNLADRYAMSHTGKTMHITAVVYTRNPMAMRELRRLRDGEPLV